MLKGVVNMSVNIDNMSYEERLRHYETEKRQLWSTNLTVRDYEKALKKLAEKWKI